MMLFKPSSMGVGRLEFRSISDSEQLKASRQKTQERKVVRFSDCLSVTPAAKESCPARCTAFYLNTTQHTYTFASTESQDWISALCSLVFQVPRFPLVTTPAAARLSLRISVLIWEKCSETVPTARHDKNMGKLKHYLELLPLLQFLCLHKPCSCLHLTTLKS